MTLGAMAVILGFIFVLLLLNFIEFGREFREASEKAGKKQYLVPYFIASHPGSDLNAMIDLAVFLKQNGYKPDQVQDFIPSPFDVAACMYYTGLDPFTGEPVYTAKKLRDRKMQRALMQFFKPENYFEVRNALREAGRTDLIGDGCHALIPSKPPREAIRRRRSDANNRGEYVHAMRQGKNAQQEPSSGGGDSRDKPPGKKASRKQSRHEPGRSYRPKG